jgi:hypothetical protein
LLGAFVVIHAPDTPSAEKSLASEASISMLSADKGEDEFTGALHDNKGRGDDEVAEAMHDDEETETDDERVALAMHDDEETETDDEMDAADEVAMYAAAPSEGECKSEMNVEFDPAAATEVDAHFRVQRKTLTAEEEMLSQERAVESKRNAKQALAECREKTGLHEGEQETPASPSTTYPHPPSDAPIANSSAAGTSPEHDGDALPPAATLSSTGATEMALDTTATAEPKKKRKCTKSSKQVAAPVTCEGGVVTNVPSESHRVTVLDESVLDALCVPVPRTVGPAPPPLCEHRKGCKEACKTTADGSRYFKNCAVHCRQMAKYQAGLRGEKEKEKAAQLKMKDAEKPAEVQEEEASSSSSSSSALAASSAPSSSASSFLPTSDASTSAPVTTTPIYLAAIAVAGETTGISTADFESDDNPTECKYTYKYAYEYAYTYPGQEMYLYKPTDLECSVCGYDLGSEFVSLCEHPTLGVPLCRDCFHDCLADPSESGEEEAHKCAW